MIKAGWTKMTVVEADLGLTSEQKPQVAVLFEVAEGESKGEQLTWYGYFSEKTRKGTILSLRAINWQGDDVSDLSSVRGTVDCLITIEQDQQGQPRPRVRFVGRGGGGLALPNRMSDDQKKAFAASLKGMLAAMNNGKTSAVEDDIPF